MDPHSPLTLGLLALIGLAGGVGITAVGPGGVLPTIGMFLLTGLTPAGVAGTAIVTHVATGALGTAAYTRSGQLRESGTRRIAAILAAAAVVGTPLGVLCNGLVGGEGFGLLLAAVVAVTGVLVWVRERRAPAADRAAADRTVRLPPVLIGAVGLVVSVAAGLFGLGGPMLSVPLLVIFGLPVLPALAAAQAQSVVIAAVGTVGYLLHGAIDWPLAVVVGVPELAGVLIGWRIAHAVPARQLKYTLAAVLVALAPYLALHG
ncbi:sulfite exporter TauE/SafE family protein [Rugosimonospora acidiphila]|uniref:Probable membrane transporter protein n=1 Tax=Rugosimonospora acidiphila TaxID=556531 RepID=A0ABP9SRY7_9ACTN